MNAMRGEIGRTLRLMVAAVMLLAALGASRLQGEAASRQVLQASLGLSLCSGDPALPGGAGSGETRHTHCDLCPPPLIAALAASQPSNGFRMARPVQFALAASSPDPAHFYQVYQSRAPPVLG